MKKIITLVLTIAVLVLGIGIYFYQTKIAKLAIESILPANPLVYIHISDIEKNLNKLKKTKLWHNIANIDIEKLMIKSGAAQEQIEQYRKVNSEFSHFVSELLLDKFFGQEVALAVYSVSFDGFSPQAMSDMASGVVLVTRINSDAEFIEFISRIYGKFNKKVVTKSEKYQSREITTIELNNNVNIVYVKIKDLLVMGLGNKTVYSCLDVLEKAKPSLCQDKDYGSIVAALPKPATSMGYINLTMLFSGIRQLNSMNSNNDAKVSDYKVNALEQFDQLAAFKRLGFASMAGEVTKGKLIVTFDKKALDPILAKNYSLAPRTNSSLNFIPKDIIAYQWMCFDPKISWDSLTQQMKQAPAAQNSPKISAGEIIKGIETGLGVDLEKDLIPALGNEVGGFLYNIDLGGPIPIPQLAIFVKINNKTVVENIINNFIEKNNFQMRSEDYKNKNIKYILSPFGTSLQPAYCIFDNYLLISVNNKLLEGCIDAYGDKNKSLSADADFQAVNFGLADKSNSTFFIKTDLLFERLKGVGDWILGWTSLASTSAEAMQRETGQYLDNLKNDLQNNEIELRGLVAEAEVLRQEIKSFQSKGVSNTDKESQLANLELKIKNREENIRLSKKELEEKEQNFEKTREDLVKRKARLSLVKIFLDEAVYPILDGLKTIKAMSSVTIFKENSIEVISHSKLDEY